MFCLQKKQTRHLIGLSHRLIGAFCIILIYLTGFITSAQAQVSGRVYRDFNANGTRETGSTYNEVGVGGVTVKCTDSVGGTGTATTAADGTYSIATCAGATRVEFTWALTADYDGPKGTGSNTSVQFINATRTNIDLGINYPQHYSSDADPFYFVSQFEANRPPSSEVLATAMLKQRYNSRGGTWAANTVSIAQTSDIGGTWGLAFDRNKNLLYASSLVKRHAAMRDNDGNGTEDIGAIYSLTPTGSPTLWKDLSKLGIDFGLSLPLMPTIATRALPTTITGPSHDAAMYPLVGKIGIGGITLSDDYSKLYVMNLFDQKVYIINTSDQTLAGSTPVVPTPCAAGKGNNRPFGLTYHREKLYVGAVCDAATSNSVSDLVAKVYSYNGTSFTSVLTIPLDYAKGYAFKALDGNGAEYGKSWQPWTDTMPATAFAGSGGAEVLVHPQPYLADIEFDVDESLILVFNDRLGHQGGYKNFGTNTSNTSTLYHVLIGGDMLRASYSGGAYTLESGGNVGGLTGAANNQGPGGGEFYSGDHDGAFYHAEDIIGGSMLLAGRNEVSVLVTDPIDYYAGGSYFFDNTNGNVNASTDRYQYYPESQNELKYGKANGLGDMELMSAPAPIEIGNRVWLDTDNDGVQDPAEAGIAGVQVQLLKGTTVISTATTDVNGNYYFTSAAGAAGANTDPIRYGITQLVPNMAYTVRFPTTTTVSSTSYSLTTVNSTTGGGTDLIDSDAAATGDISILATDLPISGANNHTFDVGYATVTCSFTATNTTPVCNDNGTSNITTDDTYTFSVIATSVSGTGAGYTANDPLNTTGTYGAAKSFGPYTIASNGTLNLTLTDNTTGSCTFALPAITAPSPCSTPVVVGQPDLEITKVADKTSVISGNTLTYTITLKNTGTVAATGVKVKDMIPAGLTFGSATASQGTYISNMGIWDVGNVAIGATLTLTITTTVN